MAIYGCTTPLAAVANNTAAHRSIGMKPVKPLKLLSFVCSRLRANLRRGRLGGISLPAVVQFNGTARLLACQQGPADHALRYELNDYVEEELGPANATASERNSVLHVESKKSFLSFFQSTLERISPPVRMSHHLMQ